MSYGPCPICDDDNAEVEGLGALDRWFAVDCPTCGKCKLSDALRGRLEDDEEYLPDRHVLSFLIREATARDEALDLNTKNVTSIMQTARLPRNPTEKICKMLTHMLTRSDHFGAQIEFDADCDYPIAGARDGDEFGRLLGEMVKDSLIEEQESDADGYSLTRVGWDRAEGVRGPTTGTAQAFVAMWFADAMDEAYEKGIAPALEECGYSPLCVKYEHHNDKVDEFIEQQIGKSGLLVADFTGQRQSVYYEVGLARGQDIPVLWTCRSDDVGNCHFDTRQYNHVVWDTPEDLKGHRQPSPHLSSWRASWLLS